MGQDDSGTNPIDAGPAEDGALQPDDAGYVSETGGACEGPNPAGCMSTGCPSGQTCAVGKECKPSGCTCDTVAKSWSCLPDCGGGTCVAETDGGTDAGSVCIGPNPAGCSVSNACPNGQTCVPVDGQCKSSGCVCDVGSKGWICLPDCGGGVCMP